MQVAFEGSISKKSAMTSLSQGSLPHGDLIPWTVGQQFQVLAEAVALPLCKKHILSQGI